MKRLYILIVITVILTGNPRSSRSQDIEVGIMLGVTEYMGELTKKHITFSKSKVGFGFLGRYYFDPRFNLKANLFFGMIEGDDADFSDYISYEFGSDDYWNAHWRNKRNLSFKSNILDFSCQGEFNILPFISGQKKRNYTPYVVAGISIFHFNPKAEFEGTWYELKPLGTEGQNVNGGPKPYSLTQVSFPYGIGFKYSIRTMWVFGFEITQRITFTDYLDDVSGTYWDKYEIQAAADENGHIAASLSDRASENNRDPMTPGMNRGNPDKKDTYFWAGFTVSKTFSRRVFYKFNNR